jgi:hypothetical protein
MRCPSGDQPGAGGKLRGITGPNSSAQAHRRRLGRGGGAGDDLGLFGAKSGSVLVVHDRVGRQRTPSARRMRRTWLRATAMPSAWARSARASRVQCAGAVGWAGASSPSPPWTSRPGGAERARAMMRPRSVSVRRRGSAGSWPVTEPVDALGVEPVQPLPHRLWVAAQLLGDLGGAQAIPAVGDHRRAPDPVAGCVPGAGQLADGALFGRVDRWSGEQQDGHGGFPLGAQHRATATRHTTHTHIEERSTSEGFALRPPS